MISILMPIYNGIEFIDESVNSIKKQTYQDWELIIGINGHEKESNIYDIAKQFECGKIKVIDFFYINGKSNTLNEMLKYSSYPYIALLDVDDLWNENKLEVQSIYLNKYDVIGSNCIWFGERPGIIPKIPTGDISNYDFTIVNPIINSSVILKKELCLWKNCEVEDYELWLRLRNLEKKFFNCADILVMHRIHSDSFFNNTNNKAATELVKKFRDKEH